MDKIIKGQVFCLGDHIDTDQIIPAKHLVYKTNDPEERKLYGKALSAVYFMALDIDGSHETLKLSYLYRKTV